MSTLKLPPPPRKKSLGEELKEDLIYWVLIMIVCGIFYALFQIIVAPFRFLLSSPKERFAKEVANKRRKVQERIGRRIMDGQDINFPINQYIERFILNPGKYVNDSDNRAYKEWHDALKKGILLDTELRWGPVVYKEDYEEHNNWNIEFLDYLQSQVNMHRQDTLLSRHKFMNTIRSYYPEFTPKFDVILSEIKSYKERAKAGYLKTELIDEIVKKGISRDLALGIVNSSEKTPETIPQKITLVKGCLQRQYCETFCIYCVVENFSLSDVRADVFNAMIKNVDIGEKIVSAIRKDYISLEGAMELILTNSKEHRSRADDQKEIEKAFYSHLRCNLAR